MFGQLSDAIIQFHKEVAATLHALHAQIEVPGMLAEELTHITAQLRDFRTVALACSSPRTIGVSNEYCDHEILRNFCIDALMHPSGNDFLTELQRCCAISIPAASREVVSEQAALADGCLRETLREIHDLPSHMIEWCERELAQERRRIVANLFCLIVEHGTPFARGQLGTK